MKLVIMAGGFPSSISEDYEGKPKPMVEIGERPILWHIMKYYASFGIKNFIICAGYKSELIKRYFKDYYIYQSDITIDLLNNRVEILNEVTENWQVTILNTGLHATIAERIMAVEKYISEQEFIVVYGDCITNIDLTSLIGLHRQKQKCATVTLAHPYGRNSCIPVTEDGIFINEEYSVNNAWINACTVVFSLKIFDYLKENKNYNLELPLYNFLNTKDDIIVYKHSGFFSAMETKRDHLTLEKLWNAGNAPWKVWKDF